MIGMATLTDGVRWWCHQVCKAESVMYRTKCTTQHGTSVCLCEVSVNLSLLLL